MEIDSFAAPVRPTDRVYVSWLEHLEIDDYVDHYLVSRNYVLSAHSRSAVLECMAAYVGATPYRKSDMDFYLDANLRRKVGALPPGPRR